MKFPKLTVVLMLKFQSGRVKQNQSGEHDETSARGSILVEAFDLPGNVTRYEA
jgi:hypothetical protein